MKRLLRIAALAALAAGGWQTGASAATAITQQPCQAGTSAVCTSMNSGGPSQFNLRTVSITSPGGVAFIAFQGSMLCSQSTSTPKVIDIVTQIVNDPLFQPQANGRGGARHAEVILPSDRGTSVSFNLAATTVVPLNNGRTDYTFRVKKLRVDAGVNCVFYNLNFSLVVTP